MSNNKQKILIIIGSPAYKKSVSYIFAEHIANLLGQEDYEIKLIFATKILSSKHQENRLLEYSDMADKIILFTPVYVDSLPYPVIRVLELLWQYRINYGKIRSSFYVVSTCGHPDSSRADLVVETCRIFTKKASYSWKGALKLPKGSFVKHMFRKKNKFAYKNKFKALELVAQSIKEDNVISSEAQQLADKTFLSEKQFFKLAAVIKKHQARIRGGLKAYYNKPFET